MSAEDFAPLREMREERQKLKRAKREARLAEADTTGWGQHTEYHFYLYVDGEFRRKVDWWPNANKWQYKGQMYRGGCPKWLKEKIDEAIKPA